MVFQVLDVVEVRHAGVLFVEVLGHPFDPAQFSELLLGQPQSFPDLPEPSAEAQSRVSKACQSQINILKGT